MINQDANETVADFVRRQIRDIVDDADVADALSPGPIRRRPAQLPRHRVLRHLQRPNVRLVNLRKELIAEVTADGVRISETPTSSTLWCCDRVRRRHRPAAGHGHPRL